MIQWIKNSRDSLNIVYVAHVGDIVERAEGPWFNDSISEWDYASIGYSILEEHIDDEFPYGIPFGVIPGNHDYPVDNFNSYLA